LSPDLFRQIILDLAHVACLYLEGLPHFLDFFHNAPHVLNFLDPLIDVTLILVNIGLYHRNVVYDFFGVF
jgi:hypothetical protein